MLKLINYLIEQANWHNSLLFILVSAGPSLLWLIICLYFDRSASEPKGKILKIFLWGCLITFPLVPLTGYLNDLVEETTWLGPIGVIFILSFLVDGLIEETSKYLILRFKIYQSSVFNELRDGFVYGMTVGLGLAFTENILYGFLTKSTALGVETIFLRGFTSTVMHFLAGGIVGYYLALYKFKATSNKKSFIWQGLGLAILFHGIYNTIARFGWWWNLFPLIILLLTVYIIIFKKIKQWQ